MSVLWWVQKLVKGRMKDYSEKHSLDGVGGTYRRASTRSKHTRRQVQTKIGRNGTEKQQNNGTV